VVIASFKDAKSSSATVLKSELLDPSPDSEIILGFEQTSPVLFMAVKPRRDSDDFV
jgi:hypothetical protein